MPSKRRNNGRSKKNCGRKGPVRCINCARCVPKDKAIKRFQMRQMVDGSSRRDIKDNYAYNTETETFYLPKIYVKQQYCVSCAIHARVVRVRSAIGRAGAKGERFRRYTTKLRYNVTDMKALTASGATAMVDQSKLKQHFLKPGNKQ